MRVDEHREILVEALRAYEAALARAGLVDPGRACALLSAQDDLASAGDEHAFTVSNRALRRSGCSRHPSANQLRTDDRVPPSISRVEESVSVRFAFPSVLSGAASPGRLHRGLCLRWARACNGETSLSTFTGRLPRLFLARASHARCMLVVFGGKPTSAGLFSRSVR